jgi:hypothetical protein
MAKLGKLLGEVKSKFANTSAALVNSLDTAAKGQGISPEILKKVEVQMIPHVRRELMNTYNASGLGRDTGELFKAVVTQSYIRVFADNIVCYLPSNKSTRFYKKAAALRYGAVKGTGGATIKRSIKLALVASGKAGGVTKNYMYFDFNGASKTRLKALYDKYLAAAMKGKP